MEVERSQLNKRPGSGKQWAGLILVILGVIFLIRSIGGYIPHWLTSWPMILIVLGIFSGVRNNFRNAGAFILIILGTVFLVGDLIPNVDFGDFVFPALVMGLGLYLILGKRKSRVDNFAKRKKYTWDKRVPVAAETTDAASSEPFEQPYEQPGTSYANTSGAADLGEDFLDTVSVFGAIKKNIFSKDFKGGDIIVIMGGSEINLSQADINGVVVIDVTQVFGGTKLIVPPQWKVTSDLAALFGGIEDKRPLVPAGSMAENKVLVLRGTSIFGGIDIRSF